MREIFARVACEWLELKLLPMAIQAAGLSPETGLDDLLRQNLPTVNSDAFAEYQNFEARTLCSRCLLFNAVMLAAELSQTEKAQQIARCIYGLMWRAATNFAEARDLDMALEGQVGAEMGQRLELAYANWDRWMDTESDVRTSQEDFLSDCSDECLWHSAAVW